MNLCGDIQNDGTYKGWYRLSQGDLNTIGLKDAKEKDRLLCKLRKRRKS